MIPFPPTHTTFAMGDLVTKRKGSCWTGRVVGWYATELTKEGYAIESSTEKGSVQIYPVAALELIPSTAVSCSAVTYQPESWIMLKDSIYAAQYAIEAGIENTQELLAKHDDELGRTTRSNHYTAMRMEGEVMQMKQALQGLKEPNGITTRQGHD